jgi:hypothetical protein
MPPDPTAPAFRADAGLALASWLTWPIMASDSQITAASTRAGFVRTRVLVPGATQGALTIHVPARASGHAGSALGSGRG